MKHLPHYFTQALLSLQLRCAAALSYALDMRRFDSYCARGSSEHDQRNCLSRMHLVNACMQVVAPI